MSAWTAQELEGLTEAEIRLVTFGDVCDECGGKGYEGRTYETDYGTEGDVDTCPACGGWGKVLPVVETEEFSEEIVYE